MAYSTQTVIAPNGGAPLSQINLSFNYLDRDEIDVYINEALLSRSAWHFNSDTQIELNTGLNNSEVILVKRRTDLSALRHRYSQGAAFRADTLDESLKQVLHIAQEATESNMSGEFFNDINMHSHQIYNLDTNVTDPTAALTLSQYQADAQGAYQAKLAAESAKNTAETYKNTANAWATQLGSPVEGGEYSAKYHAQAAASSASSASSSASSASSSASTATTQATNAGTAKTQAEAARDLAKDWATKTGGTVDGSEYSAKYYASVADSNSRLTVGTVNTVSPSTPASVSITGLSGSQTIDFSIPQGVKGDTGDITHTGSVTDNNIAVWDGAIGNKLKDGGSVGSLAVASAGKWTTTRALRVDLAKTTTTNVDGSGNVDNIGIKGTLAIGNGGTGATTASDARANLGLAIGTDVVGISGGNVSLSGNLTVGGEFTASGAGKRFRADFSSATLSNRFCFQSSTTNGNTGVNTIPNGTATATAFVAFNRSNPDNSGYLRLSCEDTSAQVTAGKTGSGTALPLKMYAGSSPVNLILDSNTLMFGTTSHSPLSYAGGDALSFSCGGVAKIVTHSGTTSPINVAVFLNPNGQVGFINTDGSSTIYSTSSDYRLKENLRELEDGIDNVLKMKPLRYNWKADGREGIGFIAHELSEIVPEAVTGEKDAVDEEGKIKPQAVDYGRITPYLVKAIQELVEEVNVLKEKINAMEK